MTIARAFFEIGTRTNFSFLEGASGPEEMVVQAARLRLGGLGIADRNSVAGVVRAHAQAEQLEERYKNRDEILVQAKKEGKRRRSSIPSGFSRVPVSFSPTELPISSPIPATGGAGRTFAVFSPPAI